MKTTMLIILIIAAIRDVVADEVVYNRVHRSKGVAARIIVTQLTHDSLHLEIIVRGDTTREPLRARGMNPLYINGARRQVFFGGFGESSLPLLIFSTNNPDRLGDAKVLCYQVTKHGGLIGHKLATETATGYGETMSGGRYELAALDPRLGAIYSVAFQRLDFGSFDESFETLRVRQYVKSLGAFIEADQGFVRDRRGKVVGSRDFRSFSERTKRSLFLANIRLGGFPVVAAAKPKSLAKN